MSAVAPAWSEIRKLPIGDEFVGRSSVRLFAFSPSGQYLACAWRSRNVVRIWETSTAAVVYDIPLPNDTTASGLSWAPDGTRFAVTACSPMHDMGPSQLIVAAFTSDGKMLHRSVMARDGNAIGLHGCAFHPSGATLAVLARPTLYLLDVNADYTVLKEEKLQLFADLHAPVPMRFSPDGQLLAIGEVVFAFNAHPNETTTYDSLNSSDLPDAYDVSFSSNGQAFLAASTFFALAADVEIKEGKPNVGDFCLFPDTSIVRDTVTSCAFTANDKYVVTVTSNGSIQVWSTETGTLDGALCVPLMDEAHGTYHPSSGLLAVGRDGDVMLFDPSLRSKVALGHATTDETERLAALDKLLIDGTGISALSSDQLCILLQDWRLIYLYDVINDLSGDMLCSLTVGDLVPIDDDTCNFNSVCMLHLRAYMLENKVSWSDQLGVLSWGARQVRRFLRKHPKFTPVEPTWYTQEEGVEWTDDEGGDDRDAENDESEYDDDDVIVEHPLQEACLTGPGLASLSVKAALAFDSDLEVRKVEAIIERVRKQQEQFVKDGLAPAWTLKWTANKPISEI